MFRHSSALLPIARAPLHLRLPFMDCMCPQTTATQQQALTEQACRLAAAEKQVATLELRLQARELELRRAQEQRESAQYDPKTAKKRRQEEKQVVVPPSATHPHGGRRG